VSISEDRRFFASGDRLKTIRACARNLSPEELAIVRARDPGAATKRSVPTRNTRAASQNRICATLKGKAHGPKNTNALANALAAILKEKIQLKQC
jgi:hypothetical protein